MCFMDETKELVCYEKPCPRIGKTSGLAITAITVIVSALLLLSNLELFT